MTLTPALQLRGSAGRSAFLLLSIFLLLVIPGKSAAETQSDNVPSSARTAIRNHSAEPKPDDEAQSDPTAGESVQPEPIIVDDPRRRLAKRPRGKRLRGAIYARYSTQFQDSIEDQIRACLDWAEANDVDVPEARQFVDRAQSGRKSHRDGLDRLRECMRRGEVDVVIIFATSRLFRKTYKTLKFVEEEILDKRLRCVFVKSGIDTGKAELRHLLHVHGMIDELGVRMQVGHIQAAHESLLENGEVFGTITYGYCGVAIEGRKTKLGRSRRKFAVDPATSRWVQKAFSYFVNEGHSIRAIAKRLNQEGAPLPKRRRVTRWTALIIRRMLGNPRYLGIWQYGASESVWQNAADYARRFPRREPLRQKSFPELRIIDDALWHEAQKKLLDYPRRAGRRAKDPSSDALRPKLLNGLLFCAKHSSQPLWVAGNHGQFMECVLCRQDPEPALVSMLPRERATKSVLRAIAQELTSDPMLIDAVIEAVGHQIELLHRPDTNELESLRQREARLNTSIRFVLDAPGETDQDRAENQARLLQLRKDRADVQERIRQYEFASNCTLSIPSRAETEEMIEKIAEILEQAGKSVDPSIQAAVRKILELVTGGRIVISQQGEAKAKRGWLRATFTLHLIRPVLDQLRCASDGPQKVVEIEFRKPNPFEEIASEAKALWDQGILIKEIAAKLSSQSDKKISRGLVVKAIAHWFKACGLSAPDGRSRRATLKRKSIKPFLYQSIAENVMALFNLNLPIGEIASQLKVDKNTITSSVKYWHRQRGLPVPDGRTRRRMLSP